MSGRLRSRTLYDHLESAQHIINSKIEYTIKDNEVQKNKSSLIVLEIRRLSVKEVKIEEQQELKEEAKDLILD